MEPVVIACGGCGAAIRIRHPEIARRRVCPRCRTDLTRDQDPVGRQSLPQQAISAPAATADSTPRLQSSRTRHVPREGRFMARPTGILIAALLLATGAMLGALTSASRSAASRVRGESPPAGPDTAPAQLAPAAALPPSPTLLAMRTTTNEGDDEKIAPAAPPLPCTPADSRLHPSALESALRPSPPAGPPGQAVRRSATRDGTDGSGPAQPSRSGLIGCPIRPPGSPRLPAPFKVRDEQGQPVVARLHGQHEGTTAPDLARWPAWHPQHARAHQ